MRFQYLLNGQEVGRHTILKTLAEGAAKKGYDVEEALAILHRAEDEEDADNRDDASSMLFAYHDGVEIIPIDDDEGWEVNGS